MENKPNIRFKGFTDDWEQRKLREMLTLLKDGTHGTHKDAEYGPLLLSAKNIKNGTVQWDESDRRISEDEYKSIHSNFKLQEGDVLLTIVGSIGETAILRHVERITFQRSVAFLRPTNNITSEFLYSEIQGYRFQKELNDRKSTSAQPGIYLGDLGEITISYPVNAGEQIAIGKYVITLDNLINFQQRQCDDIKQLKKYMLQKMFPQKDQNVPEIRFNGFSDYWEQRKLQDILERRTEQRQQSAEYPRLAFASGQGVIPLSERKTNNREQLTKDEFTKKYLVTELDDIVYNPANVKYGAIDRNKCGRGLISPIYVTFTTKEIPGFIERIVTSHAFQQKALRYEEGTVTKRQSVNPEDLITLDVLVTSKREEQKKISLFFDNLDNLITLHQRKCEQLKKLKKYMLSNMFPKKGE